MLHQEAYTNNRSIGKTARRAGGKTITIIKYEILESRLNQQQSSVIIVIVKSHYMH